jgi:small subunit ribosomal protein S17
MSKKTLKGKVVSNKMEKTAVISVELPRLHPLYGKMMKNTKRFKARAEDKVEIDDEVIIEECRPFSKEVTWKIIQNLSKGDK